MLSGAVLLLLQRRSEDGQTDHFFSITFFQSSPSDLTTIPQGAAASLPVDAGLSSLPKLNVNVDEGEEIKVVHFGVV